MSYLLPAGDTPRTKNKWGLGDYAHRSTRMAKRGSRMLGRWKLYQSGRGPGALGQDSPDCPGAVIDPITGELCANLPPLPATGTAPAPSQPGVNPAVQAAYKNLLTQQQNSQDPLDYVSPQAAIAAGLNPQVVYAAWSASLSRFPTQQSALNAGVPAGVVTSMWPQSRTAFPSKPATFLGIPTTTAFAIGGAILLLPLLIGRRR